MKPAIFYHWWSSPDDAPPVRNLRTPLIPSIATLRANNTKIPIYVIDISEGVVDWGDCPERLKFKVIPWQATLTHYRHLGGWQNLSRLFDLEQVSKQIPEDTILYTDTDIFWFKDPLPLLTDSEYFCFNRYNSGFFYFQKESSLVQRFFEVFKTFALTALNDDAFRYLIRQVSPDPGWYHVLDETVLMYMVYKGLDYFRFLTPQEHFTVVSWYEGFDLSQVRMLHGHGIMVTNPVAKQAGEIFHSRGLLCLLFRELFLSLQKFFSIDEIFTEEEQAQFFPEQKLFVEGSLLRQLQKTKSSSGHYQIT